MRSRLFAGRAGTLLLLVASLLTVSVGGCSIYKSDLLDATVSQAGAQGQGTAGDAASAAGGGAGAGAGQSGEPTGGSDLPAGGGPENPCSKGECWWSNTVGETCRSAGRPLPTDKPSIPDDPMRLPEIYIGLTSVRLGLKTPDGEMTQTAWEDFGLDLDGLCTNSSTCDRPTSVSCKSPGPGVPFDGQLCRDNTFARLQPVVAFFPEFGRNFGFSEDTFNCELWRGSYNTVLRISGYNGMANDSSVRVDYYLSTGLEEPTTWTCPADNFQERYPRWRSARSWKIDDAALTGSITSVGRLPDSKSADPEAYVRDGYLVARVPDGTEQGFLGDGAPYRGFLFKPHQGLLLGRLTRSQDGTWLIDDGLLAGRMLRDDLVTSFRQIGFCETGNLTTLYQSVLEFVDETVDVLATGEHNPDKDCDALSYAIAFEAAQLTPGQAVPSAPRVECCAPGTAIEECERACGNGQIDDGEACDTGIALGEVGACPTACPPTELCVPQTLSGLGCSTECVPMPVSMAGAVDQCCPTGGTTSTDSDCESSCGNGNLEEGETCDPASDCGTCTTDVACIVDDARGSRETCDLTCSFKALEECKSGDGCCPAACTNETDNDCVSTCGNSMLQEGELCENGSSRACPATCTDDDGCTQDILTGSAANCSAVCNHIAITQPISGDGCCPSGTSANIDTDCDAECGNGQLEGEEQCDDGNAIAGDGCNLCQTESPSQVCLAALGSDDECARCTCTRCAREGLRCWNDDSQDDTERCLNMVQCSRDARCGNPDCFCGEQSLFACLAGEAEGPCKTQVERAAKSTSLIDIDARGRSLEFPLGRANAVFTCREENCPRECAR